MRRTRSETFGTLLAAVLVLSGCGDDEKKKPGPRPPDLVAPTIAAQVVIESSAPVAVEAKARVSEMLALANAPAGVLSDLLAPLPQATWTAADGGCQDYVQGSGECQVLWTYCPNGVASTWTLVVNGLCGTTAYNRWTVFRADVSTDGSDGILRGYEEHLTDVAFAWRFDRDATNTLGDWRIYTGDIGSGVLSNELSYDLSGAVHHYSWVEGEDLDWRLDCAPDRRAGELSIQVGGATPYTAEVIDWAADGTGRYREFDESHKLTRDRSW